MTGNGCLSCLRTKSSLSPRRPRLRRRSLLWRAHPLRRLRRASYSEPNAPVRHPTKSLPKAEVGWQKRERGPELLIVDRNLRGRRFNNRPAFRFERVIQHRKILRDQLLEFLSHIVQFPPKRVDAGDLVIAGLAFVTEDRAIKQVGVLAQAFFPSNRTALGGS